MKKAIILFCILFIVIISNAQPKLVGMTAAGGTNGEGGILRYIGGSNSLNGSYSFPVNPNGLGPLCATLTLAPNGMFYGLNSNLDGGFVDVIEYDYTTNSSTTLATVPSQGFNLKANGDLLLASNGVFYGLTGSGGTESGGSLFSYTIGNDSVSTLVNMNFDSVTSPDDPQASLMQAMNGKLYGFTAQGGTNLDGTLFQYDISTDSFAVIYNLPANASPVSGSLLEIGQDSLYGITSGDGLNQSGTIFRYVIGTGSYTVLYSFDASASPNGDLMRASDGKIYGTTQWGGAYKGGTLYSFDINSNTYTDLHDFAYLPDPDSTDGSLPEGGVMQASDGMLYGMTTEGGAGNFGTIFQYNISTGLYTKKVDLGQSLYYPEGGHLVEYTGASGIVPINNYHFTLSPNPTTGSFTIQNNYPDALTVNIINLLGERLRTYSMTGTQQSFDISDLAAGIYEVQISDATQTLQVMKVVKE